jgi:endonuclease III
VNEFNKKIVKILLEKNLTLCDEIEFVPNNKLANELLLNLTDYPHAFVFGCLMDRQIPAEKAWVIPYNLKQYLEQEYSLSFEFETLYLNKDKVFDWIINYSGHRLKKEIAKDIMIALRIIKNKYNGNASEIWSCLNANETISYETVMYRFKEFAGIGDNIAKMAINVLVRDLKISTLDKSAIDILVNRHIKRVFPRVFWGIDNVKDTEIINLARELYPDFPVALDYPLKYLSTKKICTEKEPNCYKCYLNGLCKYSLINN